MRSDVPTACDRGADPRAPAERGALPIDRPMPRRLGQHFLRPASVQRLLRTIDPQPYDVFLEIGPGTGALTLPLANHVARVVAVELDTRLADTLRRRAPANLVIVEGDARSVALADLIPPGARLAGNLPYYVSSPLLRRILDLREHLLDAHVMLQEEVARRLAASPGTKEYGVLSVLFGLWADLDIPLRFPPGAFSPPPQVSSALLRIRLLTAPRAPVADPKAFERLVLAAFRRRRRTLENNLQDSYANLKESLRLLNIEGSRRAETLSIVEFARLSDTLVPK
jgi:16S rRNA (adenine1518-N6/adenine1519-N6)-dimethyltransferase